MSIRSKIGTKREILKKENLFFLVLLVFILLVILSLLDFNEKVTIKIGEGFYPADISIPKNTTVEFLNQSGGESWPASDLHPTHAIYPEFDAKKNLKNGESWSFVAGRVGKFTYHDHLRPHIKGVLEVTAKSENLLIKIVRFPKRVVGGVINYFFNPKVSPKSQVNLEVPTSEQFLKYAEENQIQILSQLASEKGVSETWSFLKQTYNNQSGESGNAHDLAHYVGQLIYDKEGFDGLKICSSAFAYGCYHGLFEKAFSKGEDLIDKAESACLSVGPASSGDYISCIHGVGHGTVSLNGTADLPKSLKMCDRLTAGASYCYDGVFMEIINNGTKTFFNSISKNDPTVFCSSLGEKYLQVCASNLSRILRTGFKMDFSEIAKICSTSTNDDIRVPCLDGLGKMIVSQSNGDTNSITQECGVLEGKNEAICVSAAAGDLVFQNYSGWQEKTKKVCGGLGEEFAMQCLGRVDQVQSRYNLNR